MAGNDASALLGLSQEAGASTLQPAYLYGVVTQASPLRIKLDGDTVALPFTPKKLDTVGALTVGSRVFCGFMGGIITIIGSIGAKGSIPLLQLPLASAITCGAQGGSGTAQSIGSTTGATFITGSQVAFTPPCDCTLCLTAGLSWQYGTASSNTWFELYAPEFGVMGSSHYRSGTTYGGHDNAVVGRANLNGGTTYNIGISARANTAGTMTFWNWGWWGLALPR